VKLRDLTRKKKEIWNEVLQKKNQVQKKTQNSLQRNAAKMAQSGASVLTTDKPKTGRAGGKQNRLNTWRYCRSNISHRILLGSASVRTEKPLIGLESFSESQYVEEQARRLLIYIITLLSIPLNCGLS